MTPADIIERREIAWTQLEDRFSQSSRVVPVSGKPAAPPDPETRTYRLNDGIGSAVEGEKPRPVSSFPTAKATQVRSDRAIQRAKLGEFPAPCTDERGHKAISNGAAKNGIYRMKCPRCGKSRRASHQEAAALRANQGRKGRKKA